MSRKLSQTERVLHAARRAPVNPVDFAAPNVRDGGKPIGRLAARINDLEQHGHRFARAIQDDRTVTYRLVYDADRDSTRSSARAVALGAAPAPAAVSDSPGAGSGPRLFDPDTTVRPRPHYDTEAAA